MAWLKEEKLEFLKQKLHFNVKEETEFVALGDIDGFPCSYVYNFYSRGANHIFRFTFLGIKSGISIKFLEEIFEGQFRTSKAGIKKLLVFSKFIIFNNLKIDEDIKSNLETFLYSKI